MVHLCPTVFYLEYTILKCIFKKVGILYNLNSNGTKRKKILPIHRETAFKKKVKYENNTVLSVHTFQLPIPYIVAVTMLLILNSINVFCKCLQVIFFTYTLIMCKKRRE